MKKVLIFYGSYGGGHLSAAKSIKEQIDTYYKNVDTILVDCIEYINHSFNKITVTAYNEMARKAPWAWGREFILKQKKVLCQE